MILFMDKQHVGNNGVDNDLINTESIEHWLKSYLQWISCSFAPF